MRFFRILVLILTLSCSTDEKAKHTLTDSEKDVQVSLLDDFFTQLPIINPLRDTALQTVTFFEHGGYGSGFYDIYQFTDYGDQIIVKTLETNVSEGGDSFLITNPQTGEVIRYEYDSKIDTLDRSIWTSLCDFYLKASIKEVKVDSCPTIWLDGIYTDIMIRAKKEFKHLENGPCLIDQETMKEYEQPIIDIIKIINPDSRQIRIRSF